MYPDTRAAISGVMPSPAFETVINPHGPGKGQKARDGPQSGREGREAQIYYLNINQAKGAKTCCSCPRGRELALDNWQWLRLP